MAQTCKMSPNFWKLVFLERGIFSKENIVYLNCDYYLYSVSCEKIFAQSTNFHRIIIYVEIPFFHFKFSLKDCHKVINSKYGPKSAEIKIYSLWYVVFMLTSFRRVSKFQWMSFAIICRFEFSKAISRHFFFKTFFDP